MRLNNRHKYPQVIRSLAFVKGCLLALKGHLECRVDNEVEVDRAGVGQG